MSVAPEYQATGPHLAASRVQGDARPVLDAHYRALLENAHTQAVRGTGLALHQVERVQVARAHVDQTAGVLVAGDNLVQLPGTDQACCMAITQRSEVVLFILESSELGRCIGQFAETPTQVAGNTVAGDTLGHQRH